MELNGEPEYAETQRQVQCWLGRCMLSAQETEQLLKAILQNHDLKVHMPPEGLKAVQVTRTFDEKKMRQMTLGQSVRAFLGSVVRSDGDVEGEEVPWDGKSFVMHCRVQISMEDATDLQEQCETMVALRNALVHHLVEQFDLRTLAGSDAALLYLQQSYEQVERFRKQLVLLGNGLADVRKKAAQCMQGEGFFALLSTGE